MKKLLIILLLIISLLSISGCDSMDDKAKINHGLPEFRDNINTMN